MQQKKTPRMIAINECAGRAKTRLYQDRREELREYYLAECARLGVFIKSIGDTGIGGRERVLITGRARAHAQNSIRRDFYDTYLELYDGELAKAGIKKDRVRWTGKAKMESLGVEVKRLEALLEKCSCIK